MAILEMYPAVTNSIPTMTTGLLSATATAIALENTGVLPAGPCVMTLGTEDNAELVYYAAISGNQLTGCVRGFGGTVAQVWPAGTIAYRAYTTVDHERFIANIVALEAGKLDVAGDASGAKVTLSNETRLRNLITGETIGKMMGKIAHWYAQLGEAAWAPIGQMSGAVAAGIHTHSQYVQLDTDGKLPVHGLTAKGVTVAESRPLALGDAGRCLYVEAATAVTLALPTDAEVAFPVDTEIEIAWEGAGAVTILPQGAVCLRSIRGELPLGASLAARYAVVVLKKRGENEWRITGELA